MVVAAAATTVRPLKANNSTSTKTSHEDVPAVVSTISTQVAPTDASVAPKIETSITSTTNSNVNITSTPAAGLLSKLDIAKWGQKAEELKKQLELTQNAIKQEKEKKLQQNLETSFAKGGESQVTTKADGDNNNDNINNEGGEATTLNYNKDGVDCIDEETIMMGPVTLNNDCLICLRRFVNQAKLERHCQLSDMHKANMQKRRIQYNKLVPTKTRNKRKKTKTVTFDLPDNEAVPEKKQRHKLLPIHLQQLQHETNPVNADAGAEVITGGGENNYSAVAKKRLQERWTKMDWTKT